MEFVTYFYLPQPSAARAVIHLCRGIRLDRVERGRCSWDVFVSGEREDEIERIRW
jgi:hypothetical protein